MMSVADDAVVHRIGGAAVDNLRLKPAEHGLTPPGISVLLGGTPQETAAQMRRVLPGSRKWARQAGTVATATAAAIRAAGFDVIPAPSGALPNHARLVHPDGAAGFTDANLAQLAGVFGTTMGC